LTKETFAQEKNGKTNKDMCEIVKMGKQLSESEKAAQP